MQGFTASIFPQKKRREIKLSSSTSSCWCWDSCCQAGEAIWAISAMTSSIQLPFEAWYTNCENKRAHTQGQPGEEVHHCNRATHTHTQGWPPPSAACHHISEATEKQDNCYCQPSCIHGQQTGAGVCVRVCVNLSGYGWINRLSTVFQRDPCIRSVFISKQSIKETGSGSVSWDQIDVVQIQEDSGPLGSVGHTHSLQDPAG